MARSSAEKGNFATAKTFELTPEMENPGTSFGMLIPATDS